MVKLLPYLIMLNIIASMLIIYSYNLKLMQLVLDKEFSIF